MMRQALRQVNPDTERWRRSCAGLHAPAATWFGAPVVGGVVLKVAPPMRPRGRSHGSGQGVDLDRGVVKVSGPVAASSAAMAWIPAATTLLTLRIDRHPLQRQMFDVRATCDAGLGKSSLLSCSWWCSRRDTADGGCHTPLRGSSDADR
jgi:hypothetical protein